MIAVYCASFKELSATRLDCVSMRLSSCRFKLVFVFCIVHKNTFFLKYFYAAEKNASNPEEALDCWHFAVVLFCAPDAVDLLTVAVDHFRDFARASGQLAGHAGQLFGHGFEVVDVDDVHAAGFERFG